ncbi:protein VASCULAR ASSOCIATED DEATH 1, chloroplastic-like [Gossypium hirsutum]|uniref:Protein VASCULAR ASSOCIATED DEATH 1, chloroplastic-like n=1 Tax=Gossypium hirsutum TaxID=3635 RepID=A0ABM2Z7Q9_GOSHI|nr:protein VASCULAR ASSOCIATED DEATH 1, chloroplastic-like [Gossypium hirsutum]
MFVLNFLIISSHRSDLFCTYAFMLNKLLCFTEFKCSSWCPHDKFGHVRDVSFQHPIKIYFGAKFDSCQEAQKFGIYRNSHLVIETSQGISDVPYGDYFRVEVQARPELP